MKVTKAVILAAGKGTRFLPYTKSQSKEMLAVVDKPTLQVLVEEVVSCGITDVLIILSPNKREVVQHFCDYTTPRIKFAYQSEVTGTAMAVNLAQDFANGQPFVVLNGDDIFLSQPTATQQLIDVFDKCNSCVVGVQQVSSEQVSKYACCTLQQTQTQDVYKLLNMVEKPSQEQVTSLFAPLGRYVFTSEIFDSIANTPSQNGEVYLTTAISLLAKQSQVVACNLTGKHFDFGNALGYAQGFTAFALNDSRFGQQYKQYLIDLLKDNK